MKRLLVTLIVLGLLATHIYAQDQVDAGDLNDASVGALPNPEQAVDQGISVVRWFCDAAVSRNWFWLVTATLVLIVRGLNSKLLLGRFPQLQTKMARRVSLVLAAVSGSLALSYGDGRGFSISVIVVALAHAAGAAFGYDVSRSVLGWSRSKKPG